MRKVIHKWFWVWDFDKEEKWLNEMAAKGLALVGVGFCRYEFEECVPGEYDIRLQLLEHNHCHAESQNYISFVEETGAEHVGSWIRWVYFRKKTAEGEFQLLSDFDSRIKQLSLIITMIALISLANLMIGISNVSLMIGNSSEVNGVGFLNLAIGVLGSLGTWRLLRKRKALKKEQEIFE
ncbi:MAG: DUF2812 domain-containing protein [Ruminococcus sp.]|nr:DUF2812 domain-containing protein [Ruminococcus sp.]